MVGCTPLGQSDRVSNALDEVLGRVPARTIASEAGRAGFEPANRLTVLAMYSTTAVEGVSVCIKRTDEGVDRERRRTASGVLRYATATCAGGTCTHITRSHVLRTGSRSVFNGRRGYGQSNALSFELRPAQVLRKSGRMDSNQQPMYSNRQSPFFVYQGPTRFLPRRRFDGCSPGRQLGLY